MDIQMPVVDGIEASKALLEKFPDIKIVALTAIENPKAIINILELGVQGYCMKNMDLLLLVYTLSQGIKITCQ